jgi:hypothetical protein
VAVKRIPVVPVLVVAAFILGALLVATGATLIYPPAGLITLGVEVTAAAYIGAYSQARRRR